MADPDIIVSGAWKRLDFQILDLGNADIAIDFLSKRYRVAIVGDVDTARGDQWRIRIGKSTCPGRGGLTTGDPTMEDGGRQRILILAMAEPDIGLTLNRPSR